MFGRVPTIPILVHVQRSRKTGITKQLHEILPSTSGLVLGRLLLNLDRLNIPDLLDPRRSPVAAAIAAPIQVLAVGVAPVPAETAVVLAVVVVRRPGAVRARRVARDVARALSQVARASGEREVVAVRRGEGCCGGGCREGGEDGGCWMLLDACLGFWERECELGSFILAVLASRESWFVCGFGVLAGEDG